MTSPLTLSDIWRSFQVL